MVKLSVDVLNAVNRFRLMQPHLRKCDKADNKKPAQLSGFLDIQVSIILHKFLHVRNWQRTYSNIC